MNVMNGTKVEGTKGTYFLALVCLAIVVDVYAKSC